MKRFWIPFLITMLFLVMSNQTISAQTAASKLSSVNGLLEEESFEGETFPPEGWTKITENDGSGWRSGEVGAKVFGMELIDKVIDTPPSGGNQVAYVSWATGVADTNFTSGQNTDQWLITPQITSIEVGDTLVFYLKYFDRFNDNLDILVSTTNNDSTASFDSTLAVLEFDLGDPNDWQEYRFDLSEFAGQDIFIAFRQHISNTSIQGDAFLLDLVGVTSMITNVSDNSSRPEDYQLFQNYPNPFNPSTQISFNLKENTEVSLKVYNLIGQEVRTILLNAFKPAGSHTVQFNAADLPNGIYYYKLEAGSFVDVKRMTLLK